MWKKVDDSADDFLALGKNVIKNTNRISVELNRDGANKGSTLVIGLAEDSDAGQYVCQLGTNEPKEIKHTVQVRGKDLFKIKIKLNRFSLFRQLSDPSQFKISFIHISVRYRYRLICRSRWQHGERWRTSHVLLSEREFLKVVQLQLVSNL
jgi:hypothetical protein